MIKYYNKPLPDNTTIVTVSMQGTRYVATDVDGNKVKVPGHRRKEAFENTCAIAEIEGSTGRKFWRPVPMDVFNAAANIPVAVPAVEVPSDHAFDESAMIDPPLPTSGFPGGFERGRDNLVP